MMRLPILPNLDKLGSKGVVFRNSFCQFPVCGPSRASMLSGLYPFESGYIGNYGGKGTYNSHLPKYKSLPRIIRESGYFTARVGKIFHMGIPSGIGQDGVDDTLAWDVAVNNTGWDAVKENYLKAKSFGKFPSAGVRISYLAPDIEDREMADGQGLIDAIGIIKENHPQKTGKPFFLAYGIYRPHPPMIVPRKHWDAIDISKFTFPEVPENDRDDIPSINFHVRDAGFNFIPEEIGRDYAHAYYASVHFVDDLVGQVVEALEKQGLADNTIIVFTGDQGFLLGEHEHWHKATLFDESCRVPLIVVDPRQKEKGKQSTNLTGLIDIYPTLCDLLGIDAPHKLSGKSLVPQLNDVKSPGKEYEFTMDGHGYSIRSESYRYTEWRKDKIRVSDSMLYDLQNDPNEYTNLVNDPNYIKIIENLKDKLDAAINKNVNEE